MTAERATRVAARHERPSRTVTTFTVAVTVRNDRANLEVLLSSLAAQGRAPDQLVVVDAASTDGTREAAERFAAASRFPVVVAIEPGPRGVGRTRCLELAKGDVVAFVDSDCVVPRDWLARYERAWDERGKEPGPPLGALGGPGRTPPDSTPFQFAVDDVMEPAEAASFHGVNTINCCYLRQAALDAGAFDPALHTAEDPDLNARIAMLGYRLLRIDNPCWHRRRDSWAKLVRQHYAYGKGATALLARHPAYFPWYESWVAPAGAAVAVVLLALAVALHPAFLAVLVALVVGAPFVVHRGYVARFVRERGLSADLARRLGVLWCAFVPYEAGVLVGRLRGSRAR